MFSKCCGSETDNADAKQDWTAYELHSLVVEEACTRCSTLKADERILDSTSAEASLMKSPLADRCLTGAFRADSRTKTLPSIQLPTQSPKVLDVQVLSISLRGLLTPPRKCGGPVGPCTFNGEAVCHAPSHAVAAKSGQGANHRVGSRRRLWPRLQTNGVS